MTLKKIILALLIFYTFPSYSLDATKLRIKILSYTGLILCAGGTYKLVKKSDSKTQSARDTISGIFLNASGISLILLSAQIINEIDSYLSIHS